MWVNNAAIEVGSGHLLVQIMARPRGAIADIIGKECDRQCHQLSPVYDIYITTAMCF